MPASTEYPTTTFGILSFDNSTDVPLAAGADFLGLPEDIYRFASITVQSFADQRSLTLDGLQLQFSTDGVNFDDIQTVPAVASEVLKITIKVRARYFRVRYRNHETNPQTVFRLQTIFHAVPVNAAVMANHGVLLINGAERTLERSAINFATAGPVTVCTAVGNRKSRIFTLVLNSDLNQGIVLKSSATTILDTIYLQPRIPLVLDFGPYGFVCDSLVGQNVNINQATGQALATVTGFALFARI